MIRSRDRKKARFAVSLFCGAGIGDVGFRAAGVNFIAHCELEPDRAHLAQLNFPDAKVFASDIGDVEKPLCHFVERKLAAAKAPLFLITCTAPCQGMSRNGQGTLLANIRKGKRPPLDPRNRLILPALRIIRRLRPVWVVFENVLEMRNTLIEDERGRLSRILDVIRGALSPEYVGEAYDVEMADYGIPQRRQRLITVFTRDPVAARRFADGAALVPAPTHAKLPTRSLKPWVSVTEALRDFPTLDGRDAARASAAHVPFHRVPVLDPKKYEWIRHARPGKSAFDNQCIAPGCAFARNPTHGSGRGADGINRAHRDTPLYCQKCGSLLPRPYVVQPDGTKRLMSGYVSAYKRMDAALPAPTLTRNLSYPCSDQKLHPRENRVLSLAEAMTLHTLSDYDYEWGEPPPPDSLIRLVIGESIPPRFLERLGRHLRKLSM